jgi:hypothetical protein
LVTLQRPRPECPFLAVLALIEPPPNSTYAAKQPVCEWAMEWVVCLG